MKSVKSLCQSLEFMKLVMGYDEAPAQMLAAAMEHRAKEIEKPGISSLFQIGLAMRGKCTVSNYEYSTYPHDAPQTETMLPELCRGNPEFQARLKQLGHAAKGASC